MEHETDHCLAAPSLAAGIAHVEAVTGVAPVPGDAHPAAGTHIALGRFVMLPVGDPDAATKGALWAALGVVVSVETAGAEWLLAAIETDACED